MSESIETWTSACAEFQRKADSRRIVEVNERDLRRERVGLTLCLLAFVVTIFVLTIPR